MEIEITGNCDGCIRALYPHVWCYWAPEADILMVVKAALEPACWAPVTTKGALYPNSCPGPYQLHCSVIWNSKPSGPSHLTVAIDGRPTAVCWGEGDRWENRDSSVCVCMGECVGGKGLWVGEDKSGSSSVILTCWVTHLMSWQEWVSTCRSRGVSEGEWFMAASRVGSWEHRFHCPPLELTTPPAPASTRNPFPIYLIKASRLLSGRRSIFARHTRAEAMSLVHLPRAGEAFWCESKKDFQHTLSDYIGALVAVRM